MTLDELLISHDRTVKEALKKLDVTAEKTLLVVDSARTLLGTITDGDIRRSLLRGENLEESIEKVYNRESIVVHPDEYSLVEIQRMLVEKGITLLPVVDDNRHVQGFISWTTAFARETAPEPRREKVDVPVVIMAGGKGSRMDPFTRVLPKPLIPIGESTIVELIIAEFVEIRNQLLLSDAELQRGNDRGVFLGNRGA